MPTIVEYLFETEAVRVSEPDQPFWYTSGLFGPYYINTHFLIGSEMLAKRLLAEIDAAAEDSSRKGREAFPEQVTRFTQSIYEINGIYNPLLHLCCDRIRNLGFDYISGGERRDFFFSNQIAWILGVPHISIFKNGDVVFTNEDRSRSYLIDSIDKPAEERSDLAGQIRAEIKHKRVLHIADLTTQASSYTRAWIPAVQRLGARIEHTLAVVDRAQGGRDVLADKGVTLHALATITDELFVEAHARKLITDTQLARVQSYAKGPERFIRQFIAEHPDFLERERQKDGKTAERVARFETLGLL